MGRWLFALSIPALALSLAANRPVTQGRPAYRNPALTPDERARDLLGRMTLAEKFWQLYMSPGSLDDSTHDYSNGSFGLQIRMPEGSPASRAAATRVAWVRRHTARIDSVQRSFVERTRLGIPIIPFEEALHGLMAEGATIFPQAIGLAASWDTAIARRVAEVAAIETRARGIRQVLSPVVNIATDVRWGRVEETYGEDPYLSSLFGDVFVRAFESGGVIATPKHFVANVGDGGRDSYPIDLSRRLLEELHFPPFVSAVINAGARSVMTSYNSVDGMPATQNAWLLNETLKGAWRFRGFVISDAAATGGATVLHRTEPNTPAAAKHAWEAGLDVVFQSTWEQHRPYWEAVRTGMVREAVIDSAVMRVLRAKFQLGLFEEPYAPAGGQAGAGDDSARQALAREAAGASLVLLTNRGGALPLRRDLRSIAVIGTDAVEARLGGYSAPVVAPPVTILQGIRAAAGPGVAIRHAPGPGRAAPGPTIVPDDALRLPDTAAAGLRGEYWDNNRLAGPPRLTRRDPRIDFLWTLGSPGRGIPVDWYSARWTGRLRIPDGGRRVGIEGNDGYRLWIDGRLVVDNWQKSSYRTVLTGEPVPAGEHDLRVEFFESTGTVRLRLVWEDGSGAARGDAAIAEAVALARASDVAVVVAGIEEGEFRDRARLSLPGRQAELIEAVAATGTPVVVVVIGGSAVTMSRWLDRVGAVVMAWYPGEQGGHAVADVLFGAVNPAGRLPITFPLEEGQLPLVYNHKPTGRGDDYVDLSGHPLFPFGHGLSYTTFEYDSLRFDRDTIGPGDSVRVSFTVRNSGRRAGHEVAQLYVRDLLASVARPVQELKGFERVSLQPGESRRVSMMLTPRHLRMLDGSGRWVVEPGAFRVTVGASSRDLRLRGTLTVR